MKLVECVPNFSEGRDRRVLDAIAAAVTSVEGVRLLDVDPGAATNRTVFTFVGPPVAVARSAFLAIEKAVELIDMRLHKGAHPRLGAADVCPFVPLGETTIAECVELAREVGRRVGEALRIPVYLYEEAASRPERRSLSEIRRGEYESLAARLKEPAWAPDFGPARFEPRSGATVIGAREFLIAYNVNLNTDDRRLANLIAQNVRETGRPSRGADGRIAKDAAGRTIAEPGSSMLPKTRATGWYIKEYGRAQVSINLTDYKVTPPHRAFEAVEAEAARLGLRVTGSEVVGLIPLEAIRMAGRHYLARQGKTPSASESELVRAATLSLGLADAAPFDPAKKIVEYAVREAPTLGSLSLAAFLDEVASGAPAPGGGSVAALVGALSGGLSAMVAAISYGHKGFEERRDDLARLGREAHEAAARMLMAVDDDACAFDRVMEANRMPKGTEFEGRARDDAIQEATLGAIEVPLSVMKEALRALEIAAEVARLGVPAALSDAGVAALAAWTALEGAFYNVRINLPDLTDAARAARIAAQADDLLARGEPIARRTREDLRRHAGVPGA
ncbi:MAG TPA: glutamate formimidoyltransferase [Candidatus Polarisedimenticolia bacterium]|jgi:glutamate formiminotransferase/formiminotetrahydrofolate cyclodeaminase